MPKDLCGVPGGDSTTCADECGVPNGENECLDVCGVPDGDSTTCKDRCGVPNGDDECVDFCGVPNGSNECLAQFDVAAAQQQCAERGSTERQRLSLRGSADAVGLISFSYNGEATTEILEVLPKSMAQITSADVKQVRWRWKNGRKRGWRGRKAWYWQHLAPN